MEYETNSYVCRYCKGSFDHVENLQKHVEQIHTPRPSKEKFKFCPLCGLRCAKYETYRDHLKHIHRLAEEGNVFILKCFSDFFVWKNEQEKRMYCKYIQQGPPKVTQFSKDKIFVYRCDSSESSTKEKKKSTWSAKDTCPSTISAIENVTNHTIKVEHWNTHVGHAIPIGGDELDAAIGSLQTTSEIIVDEQSYQGSEHDSPSGMYFATDSNDGSYSESTIKETTKKQPPALFKNNGNSSPSPTPRKFSFKKDPTKKSVSFSGSLASVACMKATVKRDPLPPGASSVKITTDAKYIPGKSRVVEASYSQFAKDANLKTSTPVKANTNTPKSGKVVPKPLAPAKPKETAAAGKVNGQFILLNSLQGPNGKQTLLLCPVGGSLPAGVQPVNINAKAAPSTKVQSSNKGKSSVTPVKQTPKTGAKASKVGKSSITAISSTETAISTSSEPIETAGSTTETEISAPTEPTKTASSTSSESTETVSSASSESTKPKSSTSSDSAEKSVKEIVNAAAPTDTSVEVKEGEDKSSKSEEPSKTPVDSSDVQVVPPSDGTKKVSLPSVSILKTPETPSKSNTKANPKLSPAIAEILKQVKRRAPYKKREPAAPKTPVTVANTTTPVKMGTILQNQVTGQQIMVPMNLLGDLKNLNLPTNKAGPITLPASGSLPSNLTPGMTYIQVNNTLIPINSLGGPNAILSTPMSSAPIPQTSQPVISFSALTQQATNTTLALNTSKSSVAGSVPGNAINKTPNNNLSVFMMPQAGGKSATSMPMIPISGLQVLNNIGTPVNSSRMPTPTQIITNNPRLQNSGNTRPLVQTNAQFVPPQLLNISQLYQRFNTPGFVTPTITGNSLQLTGPGSSQVQTIQLPLPVGTSAPLMATNSKTNSVVTNSGSISSTPAITIPSNPVPHPQKPGSFIFESAGDYFVLEPIEDAKQLKSVPPVNQNTSAKSVGTAKPRKVQSKVKTNVTVSDTVTSPRKPSPKQSVPDSPILPMEETKIEIKLPKPRNYSRFYDGKRVATLAQKRLFKEEDTDILQKVKYYNLEMKYLSSQAECKRLKLELLKSNMKSRESVEVESMAINEDSTMEQNVLDDTVLEFSNPNVVVDNPEDSDAIIVDKVTKNILEKIEENENNTKISSDKGSQIDTKDNNNDKAAVIDVDEEPMDYEDIDNEIQVDQPEEITSTDVDENINYNKDSQDKTKDSNKIKADTDKNFGIAIDNNESFNSQFIDNIPDQSMDNSQAEDQSMLTEISSHPRDNSGTLDAIAQNRELVNECLDSFVKEPEITRFDEEESCEVSVNQNLNIEENPRDTVTLTEEHNTDANYTKNDQYVEDVQCFDNEKASEKPEMPDNLCEDPSAEQTLKDLEVKYGEQDTDIYTMIRTSVLRSLYADMQDLCEQNKKLFEELQSLKSNHQESYEVIVHEDPIEQS